MKILSTHIVDDVREVCTHMAIIDQGRVLVTGEPQALVGRLEGKIWRKTVDKREVVQFRQRLISSRSVAGRTVIRLLSDETPGEGFEPVEPDLEDIYFTAIKQR
jgi:ABC-type multidrug transport system ATPase subunit